MKQQIHFLKTWPEFFEATLSREKNFEVRVNDRDFKVGDILILQEYPPPEFSGLCSGRSLARTVKYIFRGPMFGLAEGYVVMGVE